MQQPNRPCWTARDFLALAIVALCALIIVAALVIAVVSGGEISGVDDSHASRRQQWRRLAS